MVVDQETNAINLTIDGQQVKAKKGATVLEAARATDIYIPTLCSHTGLTPYGSCSMCVVIDVSRQGTLIVDSDTLASTREGIFASGDVVSGPATLAEAIGAAKVAVESIDRYINGKPLERDYKPGFPTENVESLVFTEEVVPPSAQVRAKIEQLPVRKRMGSLSETESALTKQAAMDEARRCLRCDIREQGE